MRYSWSDSIEKREDGSIVVGGYKFTAEEIILIFLKHYYGCSRFNVPHLYAACIRHCYAEAARFDGALDSEAVKLDAAIAAVLEEIGRYDTFYTGKNPWKFNLNEFFGCFTPVETGFDRQQFLQTHAFYYTPSPASSM